MQDYPNIILIDKPKGITSFDVIRRLRRKLDVKKLGHAGTLDPLATGLMIIGVGAGTKKLTNLVKLDKTYEAEVLIGERRSTGDMEGDVLEEKPVGETIEQLQIKINEELVQFVGELTLPVSAYSAIKVAGVPMYRRARKAEKTNDVVTDVPVRCMKVYKAELLHLKLDGGRAVATIRFLVGSGTYIRSLAEELGRRIGYPATVYNLRRTKIGEFDINKAQQIEDIKEEKTT